MAAGYVKPGYVKSGYVRSSARVVPGRTVRETILTITARSGAPAEVSVRPAEISVTVRAR